MPLTDITGNRYGKLVVIKFSHSTIDKAKRVYKYYWECICDCGTTKVVNRNGLVSSPNITCGCSKKEPRKHGFTGTKIHEVWMQMIARCTNPNNAAYKSYGGRGIEVCDEWRYSFLNFYNDMKEGYGENLSIERGNVNEGYNKRNCRWATRFEQSRNRTDNVYYEIDGEVKCQQDWCNIFGISNTAVKNRIKKGMSVKDAFITPKSNHLYFRPAK